MNLIPDGLYHCTIDVVHSILHNPYLMHIHAQPVFTQSVSLKKAFHTIHST